MGMFDSIYIPCPNCNKKYEAQSKSGECMLMAYDFPSETAKEPAPYDVMEDVNRHAPFTCRECGTLFQVKTVKETVIIPGEWIVEEIIQNTAE